MLIVDGFGSHITFSFEEMARKNHIVLFKLPAHSTHLTQPLDVGVFQPYKHHHGEAIDRSVRRGISKFDRLDFLHAFQDFRNQTFKRSTIRHAWRKCGIVPFNPAVVLEPLKERRHKELAERPAPQTTPEPNECLTRVPRGPESIKRNLQALRLYYQENGHFDVNPDQMFNVLEGVEQQSESYLLHKRDLDDCLAATSLRKQKQSHRNTVASAVGVVYARDCRAHYSVRLKKELETLERVAKRLQAKAVKDPTFLPKAQAASAAAAEAAIACGHFTADVAVEGAAAAIEEAEALQAQEARWTRFAEEEMPDEDDDQQPSNLRLNYPIQVREEDYVSPYGPGHLEVYRYVPPTPLDLPAERRRSLTPPKRIYGHQYTHAEAQAFVNRLYNPYAEVVDGTNM